ncbi:hypothetical protein B0H14DRAFT_3136063 [Mycena olivaceomarginata]|nr:hypothetical protein B0H14DRAFT_3136063 [Mycena olivaceomarginata]
MAFNSLLLPSVVAVMISMIGGAFLAANRRSRSPPKKSTPPFAAVEVLATGSSESWSEADAARIEHEIPRVKMEESDAMLGPASIASSGRADGPREVHAPLDGLASCKDPRSLETSRVPTKTDGDYWPPLYFQNSESTVAHPVLRFNMNHQPYQCWNPAYTIVTILPPEKSLADRYDLIFKVMVTVAS